MIGANIRGLVEPESGRLVENLTFVRNRRQDQIKGRLAVGGDHDPPAVGQVIGVADLAQEMLRELREMGVHQAIVDEALGVGGSGVGHDFRVPKLMPFGAGGSASHRQNFG